MWHATAFSLLGLLVGNLAGLSASPIAATVIAGALTLAGGSAIALFQKLEERDIKRVCQCLAAFSIASLLGLYCGVVVCEYRLLTPLAQRTAIVENAVGNDSVDKKYVRDAEVDAIDLEFQKASRAATTDEKRAEVARQAYAKLLLKLRNASAPEQLRSP